MNSNTVPVYAATGRATDSEEVDFSAEQVGFGVCLVIHDAQMRATAIAHVLLPDSRTNDTLARNAPYAFSDTALVTLLAALRGTSRNYNGGDAWDDALKRLKVYLIGGSEVTVAPSEPGGVAPLELNSGKLVAQRLRTAIKAAGLEKPVEDLGGAGMRHLSVRNYTGRIIVKQNGQPDRNL